jgi:hypothetical protein
LRGADLRLRVQAGDARVPVAEAGAGGAAAAETYCANVQVCPMYSEAIQIEWPSTAVAP